MDLLLFLVAACSGMLAVLSPLIVYERSPGLKFMWTCIGIMVFACAVLFTMKA